MNEFVDDVKCCSLCYYIIERLHFDANVIYSQGYIHICQILWNNIIQGRHHSGQWGNWRFQRREKLRNMGYFHATYLLKLAFPSSLIKKYILCKVLCDDFSTEHLKLLYPPPHQFTLVPPLTIFTQNWTLLDHISQQNLVVCDLKVVWINLSLIGINKICLICFLFLCALAWHLGICCSQQQNDIFCLITTCIGSLRGYCTPDQKLAYFVVYRSQN